MKGIGDAALITTELGDGTGKAQNLYPNDWFNFAYTPEVTELEAKGQVGGVLQTVAAGEGETTHNFVLQTQYFKSENAPIVFGHLPKTVSVTIPAITTATVPLTSAYEIADATITTANRELIVAFSVENGPLTPTANATTAPSSATQVQVDTTNNKLIFHSSAAGHTIYWTKPTAITSKPSFGGSGAATKTGRMKFVGKVYGWATADDGLIEFPALDPVGRPAITLGGDVPTFEMTFKAAVPSGWSHPYRFIYPN